VFVCVTLKSDKTASVPCFGIVCWETRRNLLLITSRSLYSRGHVGNDACYDTALKHHTLSYDQLRPATLIGWNAITWR